MLQTFTEFFPLIIREVITEFFRNDKVVSTIIITAKVTLTKDKQLDKDNDLILMVNDK